MEDRDKDKEQLLNKLIDLRKKIAELESVKINHKQADKQLIKYEELYKLIAENTSDVITLHDFNLQATFTYISPSIKDISGYEPEDLIGKSPFEFIHPDDKKELFSILLNYVNAKAKKLFAGKESSITERIEYRFKDKEGDWHYFQGTGNIVGNRLLFITRDITKYQKMLEKLKESEEKYCSLFENMPGIYYRADTEGNIIMTNPAGAKMLGYDSPEDIIGKNLAKDLYSIPEDRKKFLEELKKRKGNVKDYEVNLKKKDDTPVTISTSSHFYYDEEGNFDGVEGILVDITERKQDEKLQQVLYNISKAANSPITLDQLYKTIHKELGTIIDTTNFYIALVDEKEDKIYFPYHVDEKDDDFPILNFSTSNTITAYVIKTGKPLLNDNSQYEEMVTQGILTAMGTITDESIWLGVPLQIEGKTIGALSLGKRVGLTEYQLGNLKLLALLHDMGKIGIPDSILFKTYILTPSEWKKMKEHPQIGYRMAKNIPDFAPITREILYHHEHWDGSGYPEGLKKEEIPLLSRIISIVDAYDVMQSRRPYKEAVSKTKALKEIKMYAGTQFDPQLVEIFLKIVKT